MKPNILITSKYNSREQKIERGYKDEDIQDSV
jgi:hypothetical protein